jgi:hypothetical protein
MVPSDEAGQAGLKGVVEDLTWAYQIGTNGPIGKMIDRRAQHGGVLALVFASLSSCVCSAQAGPITTRFRWPLLAQDYAHSINYVDLDPSASTVLDWNCQAVTYDTHLGNDIMIRDFVEMDEGRFLVAAAAGVVEWMEDGYFDRASFPGAGGPNNFILIRHDDGSTALYLHHAKWSSMVQVGQRVFEGEPIALVGSAGNSSDPHVHLEIADSDGTVNEPFAGSCRAGVSLWQSPQPPHILSGAIAHYTSGLAPAVPGLDTIKERYPDLTRVQQTAPTAAAVYYWARFTDTHAGDQARVVFRRPDNAIHTDSTVTFAAPAAYDWRYWTAFMPTSGSLGTWKVELLLNGVLRETKQFVLSAAAYANPVVTGQSFNVTQGVLADDLHASDADSGIKWFHIDTAPAHGKVELFGPRRTYFRFIPESGYAGSDSFSVRAEDTEGRLSAPTPIPLTIADTRQNVLKLSGESDSEYIEIPVSALLDTPGDAFTVELWLRPGIGSNQWQRVFDRRSPTETWNRGVGLRLRPDQLVEFSIGLGSEARFCYATQYLPLTRWSHVALSYDGSYQRVYIDGQLSNFCWAPGAISWATTAGLRLGGSFESFESYRGEIDEVRWWAAARSESEIRSGAACSFYSSPLPSTLRGNWRLNGNANDSTANGLHGVRSGGASFVLTDAGTAARCPGVDTDGDTALDSIDTCPQIPSAIQTDSDADRFGDPCDNCSATKNSSQADLDRDGIGDVCDRCPFHPDFDQVDVDGDGAGDVCDPFGTDATRGVPSATISLQATHDRGSGTTTFTWSTEPKSASYEFFRGTETMVRARFYGVCQNNRDPNLADREFPESESPAAGEAFFFQVRGVGADGTRGLAGVASSGAVRDLRARDCR